MFGQINFVSEPISNYFSGEYELDPDMMRGYNNADILTENGKAEFRATVSNMKPDQVFNYKSRSRNHSLRSQESPSRR